MSNLEFFTQNAFNISEAFKYKSAFEARFDFLDIVLESLKLCQLAFVDLFAFPCDPDLAVSLEYTVKHIASGDISDS